jgi:hypothetical protein
VAVELLAVGWSDSKALRLSGGLGYEELLCGSRLQSGHDLRSDRAVVAEDVTEKAEG